MEAATRAVRPQVLVRGYGAPDLEIGTAIRPNVKYHDLFGNNYWVETNAQGMRQPDDRDPGRKSVIFYGDSFTFGFGVDYPASYFALIKTAVEALRPDIQLLNAAVPGYGSGHVKKLMERQIGSLKPAALVYFFNSNDLTDNVIADPDYRVTEFAVGRDGRITLTDVRPFAPWKRFLLHYTPYGWLNQNSHLFVLGKDVLKRSIQWKAGLTIPQIVTGEPAPSAAKRADTAGMESARPSYTVPGDLDLPKESMDTAIAVSIAHLDRIADLAAGHGLPLLVIWVPAHEEMERSESPAPVLGFFTRARGAISDLASKRRDFVFVDTTIGMPEGPEWKRTAPKLRFVGDGHFNAEGNRWFGAHVLPAIVEFIRRTQKPG